MKRFIFITCCILFASSPVFCQNIYDKDHSLEYANYLYSKGDYKESVEEYERLLTMVPDSFFIQERIILSYLKAKDYELCELRISDLFGTDPAQYPEPIMHIYVQLLITLDKYDAGAQAIDNTSVLSNMEITEYRTAVYILQERYEEAGVLIDSVHNVSDSLSPKLERLSQSRLKALDMDYKHPGLAAVMSMVIPGTGKAYSDDLQNGIRSFSIIGLYAWQSYRGFHFDGIKSFYGWAFGVLATGFYGANIYGSYASAKRSNHYYLSEIRKDVKGIILDKEFSRN
jgi:tetratricopeptide (TPR) repeat protein